MAAVNKKKKKKKNHFQFSGKGKEQKIKEKGRTRTFRFQLPSHFKAEISQVASFLEVLTQPAASLREVGLLRRLAGPPSVGELSLIRHGSTE